MQLSTTTTSADSSFASLLLPAAPPAGAAGDLATVPIAPAGNGLTAFAELFPNLVANGGAGAENISAPVGQGAGQFSLAPRPPTTAENLPEIFETSPTVPMTPTTPGAISTALNSPVNAVTAKFVAPNREAEIPAENFSAPAAIETRLPRSDSPAPRRVSSSAARPVSTRAPRTDADVPTANPTAPIVADAPQVSLPTSPIQPVVERDGEEERDDGEASESATPGSKSNLPIARRGPLFGGSPENEVPAEGMVLKADEIPPALPSFPEPRRFTAERFSPPATRNAESASDPLLSPEPAPAPVAMGRPEKSSRGDFAPLPLRDSPQPLATALPRDFSPPLSVRTPEPLTADRVSPPDFRSSAEAIAKPDARAENPPAFPAEVRANLPANPAEAKFADVAENLAAEKIDAPSAPQKTFLSASAKRVAPRESALGTGVAKPEAAMSTATFSSRPPSAAMPERVAVAAPTVAETSAAARADAPIPVETTAAAHRAVEAVLAAVDRSSAGDRHTVNLRFFVGGADLAVRVEMRADEVRTTFRTESPELRAALASEWSAATPDTGDRALRLAPPVFAGNNDANPGAFSSDTSPRERDSRARRTAEDFSAVIGARSRSATDRTPAPTGFLPRLPGFGGVNTSHHLSTLA